MDRSFAKELYSESLELSTLKLTDPATAHCDLQDNDDDGWADSGDEKDQPPELDRDLQKISRELHAIGYRNGLTAGQEAIAQEGFNIGFKQSVIAGYNWGTVRGVTSALSSLPDSLKEKLVQAEEKRKKFQELHESVSSVTTVDALKLFHQDVLAAEAAAGKMKKIEDEKTGGAELQQGSSSSSSSSSRLGVYAEELCSLLRDSPAIESKLLAE